MTGAPPSSRDDLRLPNQLRAMGAEPGALSRADGSTRFSHDGTQLLAAVWGPVEVRRARERPDRATLEVLVRPFAGLAGALERELELLLTETLTHLIQLTLHPRTLISVVIQPTHDDGSLLAAALHASCLALMHAGIPLRGMLGACTVAYMPDGSMFLDPTRLEEAGATSTATLAYLVRSSPDDDAEASCDLLLSHATGSVSITDLEALLSVTKEAARATIRFCRQAMLAGRAPLDPPLLALGKLAATETVA